MDARLVFAARRPPFPTDTGAPIRTHRLLTGLARAFETTFVTFEHHPESPDGHTGRAELEERLPGIRIVTVPGLGPGKRVAQALSLASRRSWEYGRYRLPAFRDAVRAAARDSRAGIVHFDDLGVAEWGPVAGPVNAVAPHNVEHRIIEGAAAHAPTGLRRVYAEIESRKVLREEREIWRAMSLCVAVSEVDAEAMRGGGARRVVVVPNGTDPVDPLPPPTRRHADPLRVLFVGAGAYQPNELGVVWFAEEVLPRVRERVPVELDIVGPGHRELVEDAGVSYRGRVPSVAEYYARAHAAIVPVLFGSGTRLKVVEAMAYGRPLVSTTIGAEGLPIEAGRDYFVADDAAAFAAALVTIAERCADDRDGDLARMLDSARHAVTPLFWPQIVERLVDAYRAELARV